MTLPATIVSPGGRVSAERASCNDSLPTNLAATSIAGDSMKRAAFFSWASKDSTSRCRSSSPLHAWERNSAR